MSYQDQENARLAATRETGVLYVFDTEVIEDRKATLAEGRLVHREIDVCRVYRSGDQQSAVKWVIEDLRRDIPTKFLRIKDQYERWKAGQTDEPLHGTSVRMWPAISKAQAENLWQLNIRTVEDLANIPDNLLQQIGLGARALKDKAIAWVQSSSNIGRVAEQLAAMEARLKNLEESNAEKDKLLAEKDAYILDLKSGESRRGPGRPRKNEEAA